MPNLSTFTAIQPYLIAERSEATPGLFNNLVSVVSQNLDQVNSDVFASSIAAPPIAYNVASFPGSKLSAIQAAVSKATASNASFVYLPQNFLPYDASKIVFSTTPGIAVMVREGGAWDHYDIRAYGAAGDQVTDDTIAIRSAISSLPTRGDIVFMPTGKYLVSDTLNLSFGSTGIQAITLRGAGLWATGIYSTVTNKPGIISGDTNSLGNILEDFYLYQNAQAQASFVAGNHGIRNVGSSAPFFQLQNVRVRYFGDIGVRLEGGNGPFTVQNVEVQSCASWGIHLVPFGSSVPEEVEIVGGNIHVCGGGIRITGAISTGVFDTDIELGSFASFPALQIDGGAVGGSFVDLSYSVQTVPTPAAVIYISNGLGMVFTGGQNVTSAASTDNIRLDSTAARLCQFFGGYYSSSSGGWYANVINGANQNTFDSPTLGAFVAGFGKVNNSTNTGDTIRFVGSSAVSDDKTLVLGNQQLAVASGTVLFPSLNFGGTSEVSLGLYRSAASTIAQSYGTFAVSRISTPIIQLDGGGAAVRQSGVYTQLVDADGTVRTHLATAAGDGGHFYYSLGNNVAAQHIFRGAVGSPTLMTLSHAGVLDGRSIQASWNTSRLTAGTALNPAQAFSSESSLGYYRSGVSTLALSYGTLNLAAQGVRLSMRTLAASAVTASAAKTNVAVDEIVFTLGGASGASLIIYSGGTAYGFNSAFSAVAS